MPNSLFEISMMLNEKGIVGEIIDDKTDDTSVEFKEVMLIDARSRYENMLGGCYCGC